MWEKRIRKVKKTNWISIIILSIITIILLIMAIIEVIPKEQSSLKYNKNSKASIYVTTNVKYLIGPILKTTNTSSKAEYNYYIAEDEDNEFFIIKLNEDTKGIPIIGIDINEDEIENTKPIQIYGTSLDISSTLYTAIVKEINKLLENEDENTGVSLEFIGHYYFNATDDKNSTAQNMFIATGIFFLLDIFYIFLTIKINKNIEKTIEEITKEGKIEEIKKEYESDKLIEYKKLKVDILPKYIIYYSYGLYIIPFSEIKDVYASKTINERKNKYKYIVIETYTGEVYNIAPLKKRSQKTIFNELLQKIKSMQK